MNTERSSSIPAQPEEYRAILAWICTGNWFAIAGALLIEVLLRASQSYQWPHWGNFSWTYNLVLIEFALVNSGIMLLLRNTVWLDRAPRDALGRLRSLQMVVLLLTGVHFLGFFHMTGGIQGPITVLLPPVLLTLCLLLPRRDAHPVAACFLVGLVLALLIDGVTGAPQGMLAGAFTSSSGMSQPWLLVTAVSMLLALLVGLVANGQMEKAGVSLRSQLKQDSQTGLFSREVLEQRVPQELGRIGRSESSAVMLMIGIRHPQNLMPNGDYAAFEKVLRDFAAGLLSATRVTEDTCVRYGVTSFAALLPTASGKSIARVVNRIQRCADAICPQDSTVGSMKLAIGVVKTSAASHADPVEFIGAAEAALQEAHTAGDGHQVVARDV